MGDSSQPNDKINPGIEYGKDPVSALRASLVRNLRDARAETTAQVLQFRRRLVDAGKRLRFQALCELAEAEAFREGIRCDVTAVSTSAIAED